MLPPILKLFSCPLYVGLQAGWNREKILPTGFSQRLCASHQGPATWSGDCSECRRARQVPIQIKRLRAGSASSKNFTVRARQETGDRISRIRLTARFLKGSTWRRTRRPTSVSKMGGLAAFSRRSMATAALHLPPASRSWWFRAAAVAETSGLHGPDTANLWGPALPGRAMVAPCQAT